MTMTKRVRDLFKQKFEEAGINCTGLRVGDFIDVDLECKIPLTWLFTDLGGRTENKLSIESIYFNVVDELGVADKFSAEFDWILVTDKSGLCDNRVMEDFNG